MYIEFISYIAAAFVVLLEIALVVLLISRIENRTSTLYRSVVCFAVLILAYCLLYFGFYFQDMILQDYSVSLPLRAVDYFIDALIFFLWLRTIGHLLDVTPGAGSGFIYLWSWVIGILRAAIGITGSFFMNDYYNFSSQSSGTLFITIQSVVILLTVIAVGFYTLKHIHIDTSSRHRKYVGFVSTVLCLWGLIQLIIDSLLYSGIFISAWAEGIPDTTAPTVFLIGLSTFVFVFREDFSPLFYMTSSDSGNPSHDEISEDKTLSDPLQIAAEQHGLTIREMDVLRLVYEGKNNPEIAEVLFISRNTVKKHLQSIYEKVGVNSRMELVYVVNLKKNGSGE